MRIGELSEKTEVSIRSLRYYEEKELIKPQRLENGYRVYKQSDIERVKTIQLLMDIGFSTDEISPILNCSSDLPSPTEIFEMAPAQCAPKAISMYSEKLRNTQEQIKKLKETEAKLSHLLSYWLEVENNRQLQS